MLVAVPTEDRPRGNVKGEKVEAGREDQTEGMGTDGLGICDFDRKGHRPTLVAVPTYPTACNVENPVPPHSLLPAVLINLGGF